MYCPTSCIPTLCSHDELSQNMARYAFNFNWSSNRRSDQTCSSGRRSWAEGKPGPKKKRSFCTCGFSGCEHWRYSDQINEANLRCLCGRPFLADFLPKRFHSQRDILEQLDRDNGKWGWCKSKSPNADAVKDDDYDKMDCDDKEGEATAKTPDEIEQLKKQLEAEESFARQLVNDYGSEVPAKLLEKIALLKQQVEAAAAIPPELHKNDHSKQTALLNKEVRRSQGILTAKRKALQKQRDEERMLQEKLKDTAAFIKGLEAEVETAEESVAETTRKLADHSQRNSTSCEAEGEEDMHDAGEECVFEVQARANKEYQAIVDARADERIQQYIQQYTAHMQAAASSSTNSPAKAFNFEHQISKELQARVEKAQHVLETATLAAKQKSKKPKTGTVKNNDITKAAKELKAAQDAAAEILKKSGA